MTIIDADQHLFERPDFWRSHCDPKKRDLALTIEPDDLGYWHLTNNWLGKRIWQAWVPTPEDGMAAMRETFQRRRRGEPSIVNYERDLPRDYWDPEARISKLDWMKVDKALMLPQWGLIWANAVTGATHLDVVRANLEAENRRAVEVQTGSNGRLIGVGHLTMRGGDLGWFRQQVEMLAKGGVRFAFMLSGLIDGRRWSHPDHEVAWATLAEHGVAVLFHVQDNEMRPSGLPEGWFENDPDWFISVVEQPFVYMGVQLTLSDLVLNGVLERHPALRVCCVEVHADWFPPLCNKVDIAYEGHARVAGRDLYTLKEPPSYYLKRAVRLAPHWTTDGVTNLISSFGSDHFMFGSDYPHCEGLTSMARYRELVGELPSAEAERRLMGGVAAEFLS
jgi:predicted TIM-barrel fold metal-dependent hydrolase